MEPDYYELGVYIFFLGMIVQSLFRIFDPVIDSVRDWFYYKMGEESPDYDEIDVIRSDMGMTNESVDGGEDDNPELILPDNSELEGSETVVGHRYNYFDNKHTPHPMFPPEYTPREDRLKRRKMKVTWKDLLGPPIIGLGVAWLFLPHTVFDYLGFQPRYPIIAYIVTSLLISRIANSQYDTFKTVGQFFIGIANKFKF